MKIFFIRNAPNNIAWSLKVFPCYACDEITLIPVKKTRFFMFVDYYRDFNSKCMHYIIALQKRVPFVRARSRKQTQSSFTNTLTFFMSNDIITIYVPRAFQRIYHNPLILQYVDKAQLLVCLERFCAVSDIRSRHSSYFFYNQSRF